MSGLSESEKAKMNALAGKIVPALAAVTAGASALAVLGNLLVSNYEKITPAGDVVMKPTKQETDLQSNATKQQADANTTDAIASDLGASAMKTKAGAMDIATKAMKLN